MDSKIFFENFETIANAPGGIARLRELILDLAVRGKLTEQISVERRLEIPKSDGFFDIPNNWVWSTLEEIADYGGRGSRSPNEIVDADWVLDLEDIEKTTSRLLNRVHSNERKTTSTKARFEKGDVLYGKLRPYLDKVLVADMPGYCTTEIVPITPKLGLDPQWLRISLKSPMFIGYVTEKSYGMKMPRLGTKDAKASLHAVPPIEEQKRIVAKVDELMALCDELEAAQNQRDSIRTAARKSAIDAISTATTPGELKVAWKRISNNWITIADTSESIAALRSLVLDLAVRGELDSSDRKTWKSSTLGETVEIIRGVTFPASAKQSAPGRDLIPCLRTTNVQSEVDWDDLLYISKDYVRKDSQYVQLNDVLISMANSRELVGKVALVRRDDFRCTLGGFIAAIRCGDTILPSFLMALLRVPSAREKLIDSSTQTTNIANISLGRLNPFELSLPPISEQRRIVSKVDELMILCDQLEHSLNKGDELAKKIAVSLAAEIAA